MAGINSASTLANLLELNNFIISEKDYKAAVKRIIEFAQSVCKADGYLLYIINDDDFLSLEYSHIDSLGFDKSGSDNMVIYPTVYIPDLRNKELKSLAETSALTHELINTSNIYASTDFDNSISKWFDQEYNYRPVSCLTLPIISRKENIISIAQFFNAKDDNGKTISFTPEIQRITQSICNLAGLVLENRKYQAAYNQLLESFIEVLARAIDAKSPYTGAHCQRVPVIARLLTTAAVQEETGPLKDFEMSRDDWYALNIASWLHDCGKVTTPEYIVDKATKLETIYNRIHEIRNRFEILRRDAHIEYLKKRLANVDTQQNLQAEFVNKVKDLESDFAFIAKCNIGDIPISDADIIRLEKIAKIKFTRYFDRTLGLSWAERDNIKNLDLYSKPGIESILQDREDQLFKGYNHGELYNLEIRSGTINKEERAKINEHIVVTIDMLKAIHFPKKLANVVEYAGAHHERIDGKGYPYGLTGDQMSIPAKIMAIADIFEALTSNDRPYKEPKKLSEVLTIMKNMRDTGHIDPDLYKVFITNEVYKEYAEQYVSPEQIDDVNPEDYL